MKKSLLALAALGLFAGAASAQSTVTLFGIVDAGYARLSSKVNAGTTAAPVIVNKTVQGITNSGLNSSRLGFRGVEDLGGGLRAGFWLEGQLSNDDGNAAGYNFQRRATVSLMGNFGEIRLGRDYTPHFWNLTIYDAFGTNGIGQAMTPGMVSAAGNGANAVRSNNTIGYLLPGNLGGFTGQIQIGFGEATPGAKTNNYKGGRFGYNAGPIGVNVGFGKTEGATDAADVKYFNVGAAYDFGVVKPMFVYATEKTGAGPSTATTTDPGMKVTAMEGSLTAPLGQGELRAAYSRYDVKYNSRVAGVAQVDSKKFDWNKIALGYGYNLSKRTQLYGTYARVSNKRPGNNYGIAGKAVTNNGLGFSAAMPIAAGTTSTGFETGIRHIF